jgi:dipeptidyl aminopeptidase/acylaminoacyl peptidase
MTMPDLSERFQRFDRVPAPQLWADIDARAKTVGPTNPPVFDRRVQIATIVAALVIAAAATAFLFHTFPHNTSAPASHPHRDLGIFEGVRGWIAFSKHTNGGRSDDQIFAIDPQDARKAVQLFRSKDQAEAWPLAWSPAGDRLLIQERRRTSAGLPETLIVENADGSKTRLGSGYGGSFTPDGRRVVFGSDRGISMIGVDGQHEELLLRGQVSSPVVSPDGTRMAYLTNHGDNQSVATVGLDGSDPRTVLDETSAGITGIYGISWSPDGTRLAIGGATDASGKAYRASIWVVDLQNGTGVRLENGKLLSLEPAWSPDGSLIAFESGQTIGEGELDVMQADGSNAHMITSGHIHPVWNPAPPT